MRARRRVPKKRWLLLLARRGPWPLTAALAIAGAAGAAGAAAVRRRRAATAGAPEAGGRGSESDGTRPSPPDHIPIPDNLP
ncbi:hypothetical protein [Micromonospora sp. CPCC 205556]|uniref:hypothetical protein n=1 Tax=Micromonospora sp. CPCC 205556 TaxID=3122398 RepID=UPI002FEF5BC6